MNQRCFECRKARAMERGTNFSFMAKGAKVFQGNKSRKGTPIGDRIGRPPYPGYSHTSTHGMAKHHLLIRKLRGQQDCDFLVCETCYWATKRVGELQAERAAGRGQRAAARSGSPPPPVPIPSPLPPPAAAAALPPPSPQAPAPAPVRALSMVGTTTPIDITVFKPMRTTPRSYADLPQPTDSTHFRSCLEVGGAAIAPMRRRTRSGARVSQASASATAQRFIPSNAPPNITLATSDVVALIEAGPCMKCRTGSRRVLSVDEYRGMPVFWCLCSECKTTTCVNPTPSVEVRDEAPTLHTANPQLVRAAIAGILQGDLHAAYEKKEIDRGLGVLSKAHWDETYYVWTSTVKDMLECGIDLAWEIIEARDPSEPGGKSQLNVAADGGYSQRKSSPNCAVPVCDGETGLVLSVGLVDQGDDPVHGFAAASKKMGSNQNDLSAPDGAQQLPSEALEGRGLTHAIKMICLRGGNIRDYLGDGDVAALSIVLSQHPSACKSNCDKHRVRTVYVPVRLILRLFLMASLLAASHSHNISSSHSSYAHHSHTPHTHSSLPHSQIVEEGKAWCNTSTQRDRLQRSSSAATHGLPPEPPGAAASDAARAKMSAAAGAATRGAAHAAAAAVGGTVASAPTGIHFKACRCPRGTLASGAPGKTIDHRPLSGTISAKAIQSALANAFARCNPMCVFHSFFLLCSFALFVISS